MKYSSGVPPQHTLAEALVQRLEVPAAEHVPAHAAHAVWAASGYVPAEQRVHTDPIAEEIFPASQALHSETRMTTMPLPPLPLVTH
jgi:hypothetical protein